MNVIKKLGLLIILAVVVVNAAPVQNNVSRSTHGATRQGIPWYLDRVDQREPQLDGKYKPFAEGAGVDIYILADGIDLDNKEFEGRAFEGGFVPLDPQEQCTEYGTRMASIASGKYAGVAKKANVYSINLLSCHLSTNVINLVRAVNYVIQKAKVSGHRSILAMPIFGRQTTSLLNAVIDHAVKENIVVVTAAGHAYGHFSQDACKYFPGSLPNVINVGVTIMRNGEDFKVFNSNYGTCVTLYAPGKNRSSDACSMVAGAAALVLEKYPYYTPAEVKQHLINQGTDGTIKNISGENKLLFVGEVDNDESSGDFSGGNLIDKYEINGATEDDVTY